MSQELLATEVSPPTILLIRGRAELDVVEGIPDEYLEMSGAYQMTPDHLRTHRPAGSGHESDFATLHEFCTVRHQTRGPQPSEPEPAALTAAVGFGTINKNFGLEAERWRTL